MAHKWKGDWIPTTSVEVLREAAHVALVRRKVEVEVSRIAPSARPELGLRQQKGLGFRISRETEAGFDKRRELIVGRDWGRKTAQQTTKRNRLAQSDRLL